ncbi:MAG TPA: hypothetical protein DEP84_25735, partial [Chloroflexi bacterium]|nr:hypothetical protein [Chloroflexota bacterium]
TGSLAATASAPAAAPAQLLIDDGTDTDNDGLTDFAEERVGTDPTYFDSDEDGITDTLEVQGFQLGGRSWYANALDADSNRDGIADTLEWDPNGDGQPEDTDGDTIPDLFDDDNDNDGVPDHKDLTPFSQISSLTDQASTFSEDNPFKLSIANLEAGKPTFVDFQVRPQNQDHLWFAFNVLDWPQDSLGQAQDVDQKTYTDLAAIQGRSAAANESSGDMKLVPMLEVRIAGTPTNLPPQEVLTPYNISVRDLDAGGSQKVAYVPLSLVIDEQTGQRVAFTARMRYQPTGSWPSPHEVRLAWVVQMLQDLPCDPKDPDAVAQGCQADSYIHNVPQVVQSYYDEWTLTGLNVREDHGAAMAIVYEDPAVDQDPKDDAALWALSHGLENTFTSARDQDNNGQRDVDLAEIVRRFDHLGNSGVTEQERWAIPNILRVERQDYATFDQAAISTAMTETKRILSNTFDAPWAGDNTIKPLLLYASQQRFRALSLDGLFARGPLLIGSGGVLVMDMQPQGQPGTTLDVMTGLKWTAYCAPAAPTALWSPCEPDVYWNELEQRHAADASQPGDPVDPDVAAGRMIVVQLYALTLMQGIQRMVQRDNQLVSSLYTLKTDTELEGFVRLAGIVARSGMPAIANKVIMARYVLQIPVLRYLHWVTLAKPIEAGKSVLAVFRNFTTGGHLNRLIGTGIVAGAAALIAGLGTLAYYFSEGELGAQITVKVIIIAITTFLGVVSPILIVKDAVSSLGEAGKLLSASTEIVGTARVASVIGAVIGIAITWGFFIYSMVANNVSAFSPEFNQALAETIAATIYLILLAVLSATVVGLIIVGIIAAIDAILTAICELGVDELRSLPFLDGACFTLGNSAIKAIAYAIYNYDVMVNTGRADLVVTSSPAVRLADPDKGFVAGNGLTITMPVTTTVVHKDPDPANGLMIYPYLWLYSPDNLRSSTFRYSLTQPYTQTIDVKRDQMKDEWQDVREDHKFVLTPMYRGHAVSAPAPVTGFNLQSGLNRAASFSLNIGYAIPAIECWGVLIVGVCYTRDLTGTTSSTIDALKFDIFPATLDGFMTLAGKGDGGLGLSWDPAFPSLPDADGDGLRSNVHAGLDPNDAAPDADGDGLADAYELERRAAGVGYSPILRDTDADGLTDFQ